MRNSALTINKMRGLLLTGGMLILAQLAILCSTYATKSCLVFGFAEPEMPSCLLKEEE